MQQPKVPVIIVSGYLGAGKTTLIRDFLTDPQGLRATVLVNDFGQVNIDAELIAETGADTIALTNGCACCSIGDDLLGAASAAMVTQPDLLVIEASGVAQPARMARLLCGVKGALAARCLTVVNGARARQLSRDKFVGRLFDQQIQQADAISLNRSEGLVPDWLETIPQSAALSDFVWSGDSTRARPKVLAEDLDVQFTQTIHHPEEMDEVAFHAWLLEICPSLHRAKGVFPMRMSSRETVMARVDYVQGELTVQSLPERNFEPSGQIVVITPRGA